MADARRRSLVATGIAACLFPGGGWTQSRRAFVDGAGRKVALTSRVERIYAAGPPASILVFAVAPDKLIGWTSAWRETERPFIARRYADLPTLGRLTGRGNTANVEVVLAAKPDVVVDYGTINPTYSSLAARVQQQTGVPYLLLDRDFDRMAEAIRQVGAIAGEERRAESLSRYTRETVATITERVAKIPADRRPRVYYGRGPQGLTTGLAGSINVESIEQLGAVNVAAEMGRGGLVLVSVEQVLRWLARILYPQAFPEDLRPIVRDFYTRCYHQAPSEAQLDRLLRTAGAGGGGA